MKKIKMILVLMVALSPAYAMAAADVKISITAEKVIMVEKDGKKVEKLVAVEETVPGDVLQYTLNYSNKGDEKAKDAIVNDPIPSGTLYVVDSAFGPGAEISFSIDKGKSFKQPSLLKYEVKVDGKTQKRKATPDKYTDIRWKIKEIAPGKSGMAGFRVRVK